MLSFFGETCLKEAVVARIKEHQRLDQIIQRVYWDGSKGCAIGCVLHSDDHLAFERQLGLPIFLAYMDEHIFESLSAEDAKSWPLRFVEAVPVGVDLELVFPRFTHWLLTDPDGIVQHANSETRPIIETLAGMYARRIEGIPFDIQVATAAWSTLSAASRAAWSAALSAWSAASRAAWIAALSAESADWSAECADWSAEGASWRAARRAAWSAEMATLSAALSAERADWSAEGAARRATWRAAWSAALSAESAAWSAEIHRQADYLIALLQSYESKPLNTKPCPEKIRELLPIL